MKWISKDGGEDLHSEDGRFRILFSDCGYVAIDAQTGESSNILDSPQDAEAWCLERRE